MKMRVMNGSVLSTSRDIRERWSTGASQFGAAVGTIRPTIGTADIIRGTAGTHEPMDSPRGTTPTPEHTDAVLPSMARTEARERSPRTIREPEHTLAVERSM